MLLGNLHDIIVLRHYTIARYCDAKMTSSNYHAKLFDRAQFYAYSYPILQFSISLLKYQMPRYVGSLSWERRYEYTVWQCGTSRRALEQDDLVLCFSVVRDRKYEAAQQMCNTHMTLRNTFVQ